MDAPSKPLELLPTPQARWAAWLSIALAGLLYGLLVWLQVDTLLPLAVAGKLAILLPPAALLLLGSFVVLFFVVRAHNKTVAEYVAIKAAIKEYVRPPGQP
jgi:uncharacterized SAM-binding protein YcdF (DUF218 family)